MVFALLPARQQTSSPPRQREQQQKSSIIALQIRAILLSWVAFNNDEGGVKGNGTNRNDSDGENEGNRDDNDSYTFY